METDWIGERIGSAPRRAVAGILIESEWKTRLRERGGGGGGRNRGDDKVIVQFRKLREKKGGREGGRGEAKFTFRVFTLLEATRKSV